MSFRATALWRHHLVVALVGLISGPAMAQVANSPVVFVNQNAIVTSFLPTNNFGGSDRSNTGGNNQWMKVEFHYGVTPAVGDYLNEVQFKVWIEGLDLLAPDAPVPGKGVAVALTGSTLTLGSMVGFVALFGMAARNTILLVSHFDHLVQEEGQSWSFQTALRGAEERLTPVLLTALLTAFALLPVAIQGSQAGHEIEGPMAIVILGGLISSTCVSLLLIPPLAARWLR